MSLPKPDIDQLAADSAHLDSIRQEIEGEGFEDMGDLHLTIRGAIKSLREERNAKKQEAERMLKSSLYFENRCYAYRAKYGFDPEIETPDGIPLRQSRTDWISEAARQIRGCITPPGYGVPTIQAEDIEKIIRNYAQ